MQISITFTMEELEMISKALVFGIVHTTDEKQEMKFKMIEQKIAVIAQLSQ